MDWVLVTPEEDEQLTLEMQTEVKRVRSPVLSLPLPYCRDRNPSRRDEQIQTMVMAMKYEKKLKRIKDRRKQRRSNK